MTAQIMAIEPDQIPKGDEITPTPIGTEGDETPQTTPKGDELPPEVDYKKKFSDSAREVQRLLEEDKLRQEKIAELEAKLAETSENLADREFSQKYPEWEMMTETEKTLAKEIDSLKKESLKAKEEKAWQNDFQKAKSKFPKLSGREDEFKEFCYKYPKSIDAETLAKSFLFEEETPQPKKGLEKPTSGSKVPPKSGYSLEDIKNLRESDFKTYIKLIRQGKIKEIPEE